MIPIVKERIIKYLQGDPNVDESKLGIDPEREHMLLMNLFKSGNYTRTGGTDWHDKGKERTDDVREEFELTMGRRDQGYVQSGFNSNDDKSVDARVRFDRPIVNRDGSIAVTMNEGSNSHIFVFTKDAIMNLYKSRRFKNRFDLCNQYGIFMKCENKLRRSFDQQIIMNKTAITTSERITAVYITGKEANYSWTNVWDFDVSSHGPDVINFAYGDEVRYCAFIAALNAALINGSHGGIYEDFYQELCYGAA